MTTSKLTDKQARIIADLYDAFADRDYPRCIAQVRAFGTSEGDRTLGTLYVMGIGGGELEAEPNLQAHLILTIAHLRLGDRFGAETPVRLQRMTGGTIRKRLVALLGLSLREVKLEALLADAASPEQRLQAYYYEAEGLVTDREFVAALALFRRCLELPGSCPEREFARARVAWLTHAEVP